MAIIIQQIFQGFEDLFFNSKIGMIEEKMIIRLLAIQQLTNFRVRRMAQKKSQ